MCYRLPKIAQRRRVRETSPRRLWASPGWPRISPGPNSRTLLPKTSSIPTTLTGTNRRCLPDAVWGVLGGVVCIAVEEGDDVNAGNAPKVLGENPEVCVPGDHVRVKRVL